MCLLPHIDSTLDDQDVFYQWLQQCMDKVAALQMFGEKKPNHVLINEYKPNEGIMVILKTINIECNHNSIVCSAPFRWSIILPNYCHSQPGISHCIKLLLYDRQKPASIFYIPSAEKPASSAE